MKVKVRDLLDTLTKKVKTYGPEFLDYTICIECLGDIDLESKRKNDSGWKIHKDSEGVEWIEIEDAGDITNHKEKFFGISANY